MELVLSMFNSLLFVYPLPQVLHSNLDHVERRTQGVTGGTLYLLCKDLRRLQLDVIGADTFSKVADTLEDLSRVGEKTIRHLTGFIGFRANHFIQRVATY